MNNFITLNTSKPAIWKKLSLFILAVMMVLSAPFNAIAASLSEEPVTVAEWKYDNTLLTAATTSLPANLGENKDSATLSASKNRTISAYNNVPSVIGGWDLNEYWLIALSTKGFEDMSISLNMRSDVTGPRLFKLEYSSDGSNWTPFTDNEYDISVSVTGSQLFLGDPTVSDCPIPRELDNLDNAYIRLRVSGFSPTLGLNPSLRCGVNNIIINGMEYAEPIPTTHTVTYNAPGDTFTDGNKNSVTVEVNDGDKVVRKYVNGRSNASQVGWLTEDGEIFDFNTPVTKDIVLTIKWLFNPAANPSSGELRAGDKKTLSSATEGATFEYIINLGLVYTPSSGELTINDSDFDTDGKITLFVRSVYGNTKTSVVRFYYTKAEPLPAALVGIDSMRASWFTFDKNNVISDGNGNLTLNVDALANIGGIAFQEIVFNVENVPDGAAIVCEAGWRYADGSPDYWPHQNERNLAPVGENLYKSPHNNTNLTKTNINTVSAIYRLSVNDEVIGTFVISYTAPTFIVTYDADNGAEPVRMTVNGGTQLSEPARPIKEGYTFKGWYLEGKAFTFGVVFGDYVTSDITLNAMWETNKYTVTFDSGGGNAVAPVIVNYGEAVTEPSNPTKEGYSFTGWYLGEAMYNFDAKITANISLTAKWEAITLVSVTSSAYVDKMNGNQNRLNITIIEVYSDGGEKTTSWSGMINNNAAGTYEAGDYTVYVDTKGNDQIRACFIVE